MEYEYLAEREPQGFNLDQLIDWLNSYGKIGWELCNIIDGNTVYVFKRQVKE